MLDKLIVEVEKRKVSYDHLLENYKLFFKLKTMSVAKHVLFKTLKAVCQYPNDLEPFFIN